MSAYSRWSNNSLEHDTSHGNQNKKGFYEEPLKCCSERERERERERVVVSVPMYVIKLSQEAVH